MIVLIAVVAVATIVLFLAFFTFHDQSGVGFGASLNATTITQNQTVRVNLYDWNTLDFKNSLPESDGLRALNLSSGPCGGLYPTGIAVYEGAYDLNNYSSTSPLAIYAPGIYSCPLEVISNSFTFAPLQNITAYVDLSGYWTPGETLHPGGGASDGVLHPFLPGVYTVITGDAWGRTKLLYFRVSGARDTITIEGLSLCPSNCNYPSPYLSGTVLINSTTPLTKLEVYVNGTSDGTPIDHIVTLTTFEYSYKGSLPDDFIPATPGDAYAVTFTATFQDGSVASATEEVYNP